MVTRPLVGLASLPEFSLPPRRTKAAPMVMPIRAIAKRAHVPSWAYRWLSFPFAGHQPAQPPWLRADGDSLARIFCGILCPGAVPCHACAALSAFRLIPKGTVTSEIGFHPNSFPCSSRHAPPHELSPVRLDPRLIRTTPIYNRQPICTLPCVLY